MVTPSRDIPGFFDALFDWIAWLRIAISPAVVGALVGGLVYLLVRGNLGILLWILIAVFGVMVGVVWANHVRRSMSPLRFMSHVIGTPELDDESKLERLNEEEMKSRQQLRARSDQ